MTKIITALLLALASVAARSAAPDDAAVKIEWDSDSHDFGTFNEDLGPVTHIFRGRNVGTDTAVVTLLSASCGCTRPTASPMTIPPGDSVALSVTYDPARRPGAFNKNVTFAAVPAGKGKSYRTRFTITGRVLGSVKRIVRRYPAEVGTAYRVDSRSVSFGNIVDSRSSQITIQGYNSGDEPVVPVIKSKPGYIAAAISPDTVAPGKTFAIELEAFGPQIGVLGMTLDSLTISEANHPAMSLILPTSIYLYEDFGEMTAEALDNAPVLECLAPEISFGTGIDPRSSKPITRKALLTNTGKAPAIIRRAYTLTPGISVKAPAKPIAPGMSAEIEIVLRPSELPAGSRDLDTRVSVISNCPLTTNLDLRLTATLAEP